MAEPKFKAKIGCVSGTVFENTDKKEPSKKWRSFIVERNYKDGDEWKSTSNFNLNDLPKVQEVSRQLFAWNYANPIESDKE